MWCDDYNKTINSLQLLKENDIEFNRKIKIIGSNYEKNDNIEKINKVKLNNKNYLDYINIKCMSLDDIWEMKKNLLFEFCDINKRVPKSTEKYKEYNIGSWLHDRKKKINNYNNDFYKILSVNDIVKNELDRYIADKEKNKDKIKLSFEESKNLLFEFCNIKNRVPKKNEKYKEYNISSFLQNQKKKINNYNDDFYKILSVNNIVKKELDRYILDKNKRNNKITVV
jgi:hypothetical protein